MHLMPKTTRQTEHQVIRESTAIVQIAIAIAGELSNKLSSKLIENTEQTNEKGDIKKERSTDRQTNRMSSKTSNMERQKELNRFCPGKSESEKLSSWKPERQNYVRGFPNFFLSPGLTCFVAKP